MKKRVAVAMSGGVDSSVVAALLKKDGYEVIGITMQIWPKEEFSADTEEFGTCCSLSSIEDAKSVASKIGIDHYVLNFRDIFKEKVINNFISEYCRGRTPNPCIRCNEHIKFRALLNKAKGIGCDYLATGHYAKIEKNPLSNRYKLMRGKDKKKDQSYVLYMLKQEQLEKILFPLGDYKKEEIRKMAEELNLPVANKPESQEICFVPDNKYAEFVKKNITTGVKAGDIVDTKGNKLGNHKGLIYYTCGQRKRLGISSDKPLYVIQINKDDNTIIVGSDEELDNNRLLVDEINFINFDELSKKMNIQAQIRYNSAACNAIIKPLNKKQAEIIFEQNQKAIAPGQACVFYKDDEVIGGGTIEKAG